MPSAVPADSAAAVVKFTIPIPHESCTNAKAKYSSSVVPPDPSVHLYHCHNPNDISIDSFQWLNYSAIGGGSLQVRGFEGLKLEPEGQRAEVGFLTADQGFSSIQGTLFGFCGI